MARSAMLPLMILCSLPILSLWVGVDGAGHHLSAPPAPLSSSSVDCSSLILDMADCVSFVTNGSNVSKPEGSCCSGLKTVLNTDAQCLCEAFNNSTQYGVPSLNVTKALSLPSACNLRAPSAPSCGKLLRQFVAASGPYILRILPLFLGRGFWVCQGHARLRAFCAADEKAEKEEICKMC